MKHIVYLTLLAFLTSCVGLKNSTENQYIESGVASWYGPGFQGKKTANGEIFDTNEFTAAHRTLPFNSIILVVNTANEKTVSVRINDRGPYAKDRIIDLSKAAAERLDMINEGTAPVKLYLRHEPPDSLGVEDLKKPTYTVQIGSFSNLEIAKSKASEMTDGWVKTVSVNRRKVYRVFVGKFDNVQLADERKSELAKTGVEGFVKQIEN